MDLVSLPRCPAEGTQLPPSYYRNDLCAPLAFLTWDAPLRHCLSAGRDRTDGGCRGSGGDGSGRRGGEAEETGHGPASQGALYPCRSRPSFSQCTLPPAFLSPWLCSQESRGTSIWNSVPLLLLLGKKWSVLTEVTCYLATGLNLTSFIYSLLLPSGYTIEIIITLPHRWLQRSLIRAFTADLFLQFAFQHSKRPPLFNQQEFFALLPNF